VSSIVILPNSLDLAAAPVLWAQMRDRAQAGETLICDGAGVERALSPGLQSLVFAAQTVRAAGGDLLIETPSAALVNALRQAGLAVLFPLAHPDLLAAEG